MDQLHVIQYPNDHIISDIAAICERPAMYRFKVFASAEDHHDLHVFENRINVWLNETDPVIHLMGQSAHDRGVMVTFIYEISPALEEVAAAETAVPEVFQEELDQTILDPERSAPLPSQPEEPPLPTL
jgi:hypothetical protein